MTHSMMLQENLMNTNQLLGCMAWENVTAHYDLDILLAGKQGPFWPPHNQAAFVNS